jgi:hypothetical protein
MHFFLPAPLSVEAACHEFLRKRGLLYRMTSRYGGTAANEKGFISRIISRFVLEPCRVFEHSVTTATFRNLARLLLYRNFLDEFFGNREGLSFNKTD